MVRKLLLTCMLIFIMTVVQAQDADSQIDAIKYALMNGNYEKGLNDCKSFLELNAGDSTQMASVFGYAGLASEALGNKSEAIHYYKKAVEFKMPQLDVYDKLINLSKKEKNDSVYEYALIEKLKAYPDYNQEIKKSLAYLYINNKQYQKLLNTTNELLEWFPGDINYLYFKGVASENLEQPEEAEKYYKEVLKLDPNHTGANMSLGMKLYSAGSEVFAFRKKEYEAKAKPNRVDYSVYNKGIEEGKNLYRQALPHLLIAYESGSYPGLKQVLFNTYARLEQKDKAEAYR